MSSLTTLPAHKVGRRTLLMCGATALVVLPASGTAQAMPATLAEFLRQTVLLSPDQLAAVTQGTAVVKVVEPADRRELAVFGIIRIGVPRPFFVNQVAEFPASLRDSSMLRFGTFSTPAAASDVAAFVLPHGEVRDLRDCKPGDCKLKLPAAAIAQLRVSIDSAPAAADSIATGYFRRRMVEYVTAYRERGNAALTVYDDAKLSTAAGRVFSAMLSGSPWLYQYAPSLERYLEEYPGHRPADLREALFWSVNNLPNLRPTLILSHVVAFEPPEMPGSTLIASKQLYADHYLDGGLVVTAAVDQAAGQGPSQPGVFVVTLNRLHFDDLPSGGLLDLRGKLIGGLRDQALASLRRQKARAEQAYAGARPASR